jgi:hypothetical protein
MATRRRFLAGLGLSALGAALGVAPLPANGQEQGTAGVARLHIPGLQDPRSEALADLLEAVQQNSSLRARLASRDVDPASQRLFETPFVVLTGDRAFEPLSELAVANLRLYLREGGFLFVDDASGRPDSAFDRCVRRDLARILPGSKIVSIGRDHAVYRSFFLLGGVAGRMVVRPYLEGVWQGDITPVLYSSNDLLGALWRSSGGGYALEVIPGGARQRSQALRLAINVVVFALTGNYKRDAVHVRALLKRMRRQGGYAR